MVLITQLITVLTHTNPQQTLIILFQRRYCSANLIQLVICLRLINKLKITEKKLFVKQIVLNSSLNTSFNPNRIRAAPIADLNFEVVIEGDCLAHLLKPENRKIFGKVIEKAAVVLV